MEQKSVKIADLAVLKKDGVLVTVGLGSCVGIALYDDREKVAGLAHILLSDSSYFKNKADGNEAKFADTAIPVLINNMTKMGCNKNRLKAKIAGGSSLFAFNKKNNEKGVGEKNIEATRITLKKLNIPLISEDVGGNYGRTMRLFADSGKVVISTVGKGEKDL